MTAATLWKDVMNQYELPKKVLEGIMIACNEEEVCTILFQCRKTLCFFLAPLTEDQSGAYGITCTDSLPPLSVRPSSSTFALNSYSFSSYWIILIFFTRETRHILMSRRVTIK